MDPYTKSHTAATRTTFSLWISALALSLAIFSIIVHKREQAGTRALVPSGVPSLLARINSEGVLHAGYGVTPPYSLEDPNTKRVTGFTVDIVERIAKDWRVQVKWHRLNWNTFIPDIKRGEFDMIGEPIFTTLPRTRELGFSDPIDYFPEGVVTLRKDETRFKTYEDLNKPGIKVAVQMGFASETIARAMLPKADILPVAAGTDQLQLFNEVALGRADAASSEGGIAKIYLKEHPDSVRILNLENPAALVPGAFAFRFDDPDAARAFSVSLRYLRLTGELESLRRKWGLAAQELPSRQ